jgi:hypothetical protein
VCSRSKRCRNACHQRSTSALVAAVIEVHSQTSLGSRVAGQVIDLQPDQGALDDGQLAVVVDPAGAAGQPGVDLVPAGRDCGAVAGGLGADGALRGGPGGGPVQGDLWTVFGWAFVRAGPLRRLGQAQHSVGAQTTDQLDGQLGQDVGEPGDVVTCGGDDEDLGVTGPQCPAVIIRPITARSWSAVTAVGSSVRSSRTASSMAVQQVRPHSRAATNE